MYVDIPVANYLKLHQDLSMYSNGRFYSKDNKFPGTHHLCACPN